MSEWGADLWRAVNHLTNHLETMLVQPALRVNWQQWELLRYTCDEQVTTVQQAARWLGLPQARIAYNAGRLRQRGLLHVQRAATATDATIAPTDLSHQAASQVRRNIAGELSRLLCPLPAEHVLAVLAVVDRTMRRATARSGTDTRFRPMPTLIEFDR